MDIFGNDTKSRGCFHRWTYDGDNTIIGMHLVFPNVGEFPLTNNSDDPFITTSAVVAAAENYQVTQCFGGANYLYAFGHNAMSSAIDVGVLGMLVSSDGTKAKTSNAFKRVIETYRRERVSEQPAEVRLVYGNQSISGFLVGLRSATQNPEMNLQSFTFNLVMTRPLQ